ncbi:MAG TPA: hypothetical protein ENK52_03055 [Saprospiraceae bacterium]|nr:hypothetical protein [Saprospiraceae bacterium]
MPFEIAGTPPKITGHCHIYEGSSTDGAGAKSVPFTNRLIQDDQTIYFTFHWKQHSNSFWLAGGHWHQEVYLELMGPGEASKSGGYFKTTIAAQDVNGSFSNTIKVAPGKIKPGVYRVTCSMQYYSNFGSAGGHQPRALAAFDDLGIIKVYHEEN